MASINLDLNYFDHIKTVRLLAKLGPGADVLPLRLWVHTGRLNPAGGSVKMTEAELEYCLRWWGAKGALCAALIETGFATRDGDMWFIHDWFEHSGHLAAFHKRAKKAARIRWGMKRKPSNASSNAKNDAKQCSGRTSSTITKADPPGPALGAYQAPPASHPNHLVSVYKELRGTPLEDRSWDKIHFSRAARAAHQLVEVCGSVDEAKNCLLDVAEGFKKKGISWTIETVVKRAHDWKVQMGKNGNS